MDAALQGLSQAMPSEPNSSETDFANRWTRSADAAAAVHQIRNRLQSIIIETALLKRGSSADPAALARISALAQDGASQLEIFGELIDRPSLEGVAPLKDLYLIGTQCGIGIDVKAGIEGISVALRPEALMVIVNHLVQRAAPFRGFRAKLMRLDSESKDRVDLVLELEAEAARPSRSTVTPWLTAQQMARDVGGSLELHSGEPPLIKLRLPK